MRSEPEKGSDQGGQKSTRAKNEQKAKKIGKNQKMVIFDHLENGLLYNFYETRNKID